MGFEWRSVYRDLGYSDGQLDQFKMMQDNSYKEMNYQILLDWKQTNDNPTLGHLCSVIWKKQKDPVWKLRGYWKAKVNGNSNGQSSTENLE